MAVVEDPLAQMVVLDYYDGPVGGLLKCKVCGSEYHFYLLDWDEMHAVRIFALAPLPKSSFERIFGLFEATPDRRVWCPPWPTDERTSELYESGIQNIIGRAASATVVIAWDNRADKTLAMRGVDAPPAGNLSVWFDRQPGSDPFDWFGYLRLAKS
jgi:hypothetical protein